jgi:hypothetical protein
MPRTATIVLPSIPVSRAEHDALQARVAVLERLQAQPARPQLSRADRQRLGRVLPAVAGVLGSEWFLSREVVQSGNPALRLVTHGLTPKSLGRLLRRATDQPVGGFVVRRAATERGAVLWCVEQIVG